MIAVIPGAMMTEKEPTTVTVRIDPELARMARIICAHTPGRSGKQMKMVDYLDSLLRERITDRYEQVMQEIARSASAPKKKQKE